MAAMSGATTGMTPEDSVNALLQEVAGMNASARIVLSHRCTTFIVHYMMHGPLQIVVVPPILI